MVPKVKRSDVAMMPGTLVNGQKYTVDVQVRLKGDGVDHNRTKLDGKPLLSWAGKQQSLKQNAKMGNCPTPDAWPRRVNSPVTFHTVLLRRLVSPLFDSTREDASRPSCPEHDLENGDIAKDRGAKNDVVDQTTCL